MNLARYHSLRLNLYAAFRKNHPVKPAGDCHVVPLNLALHFRTLSKDQRLLRDYVSLYLSFQTKRPRQLERSLQPHPFIQKSSPLLRLLIFSVRPFPRHKTPLRTSLPLYSLLWTSQDNCHYSTTTSVVLYLHQPLVDAVELSFVIILDHKLSRKVPYFRTQRHACPQMPLQFLNCRP